MKRSDLLKRLYLTGVGILLATAGIAQTHNTYTNPLRTADGKMIRVADPFVFRYDSLYYMTGTTRQNSGFDCYSSPDLVHWTFLGEAYTKPEGHPGIGGFWAPEVFVYRGKFYMTYSSYNPKTRIMLTSLAVADSPRGRIEICILLGSISVIRLSIAIFFKTMIRTGRCISFSVAIPPDPAFRSVKTMLCD